MTTIPGASGYLNAATLANKEGTAAQAPTLLGSSVSETGLLEAGRGLAAGGTGLSSTARSINQQFLNNSANINKMFSLGVGTSATVDGLRQEVLALRAGKNDSQLAPSLRGNTVDTEA